MEDRTDGFALMQPRVKCVLTGEGPRVADRVRSVLRLFEDHDQRPLPQTSWVVDNLPGWLRESFQPAVTEEEVRAFQTSLLAQPIERRMAFLRGAPWTLETWLSWFEPGHREWTNWRLTVDGSGGALFEAITLEPMMPKDALSKLFFAAGASTLEWD